MPTFIDYLHDYKTVNVKANSVSLWSYVVIALSTALFIGAVILLYYKCCKHRARYDCGKRLADFCDDKNVVTSKPMVGGDESASSGTNEVVSSKPGGRSSSTPDRFLATGYKVINFEMNLTSYFN